MIQKKGKYIERLTFLNLIIVNLIAFVISGCGGGDNNTNSAADLKEITVSFGSVVLDHVADQTVLLNNNGSTTITIGQIDLVNPPSAPFSILRDECSGMSLTSSDMCTLQFRFLPTDQGAFSDTFYIPSDDLNRHVGIVNVSGEAIALNVSINQVVKDCPNSKIKLYATVTDRNDDPLTLIPQKDFSLSENGALTNITRFSNIVSSPLSVVLALDYSGSTEPVILDIENAATFFIENLQLDNGTDEAAIIKFSRSIQPAQVSFTDNEASLKIDINNTPFSGDRTGTILFDVVGQSSEEIDRFARNFRRAIIVISDGYDNSSVNSLTEVIDLALENIVPVFTIGVGNVNIPVMQRLADQTGGQFFQVLEASDIKSIYEKISNILNNQYLIEYTTFPSSGEPIAIDVQVDFDFQGEILHGEDEKEIPGC